MSEVEPQQLPEGSEEQEISYAEILATAILNGEIVITIFPEEEEKVKTGIKNYKSKQATKARDEGQPVDNSLLIFEAKASKDFEGCIDLSIQCKNRGTVKIKAMRIPEGEIPD